jgi:outer membrane protein TolC
MQFLALLALAGAFSGAAMEHAPPVDELVRDALSRSPALAAARARIAAAQALEISAAALPDPMVEAMFQNEFCTPASSRSIRKRRPSPLPGSCSS